MKKLLFIFFMAFFCLATHAERKTDVLTFNSVGIKSGTAYDEYTYSGASGAIYKLQCAGNYQSIQLRSNNNNSGIVVAKKPQGKIVSISIDWNTNTDDARILNIYSSSNAYNSPAELYTSGLSTIASFKKSDGNKTITLTSQPDYIGLRSSYGAMYINSISIVWDTDASGGETPSPSGILSVAEAISLINNGYTGQATVKGTISKIDSYNSTYKQINYWISDDGKTSNQLYVYGGLGLNGNTFNSLNDLELGAVVVITGNIKNYNGTPEFDVRNYLLEYNPQSNPATGITLNKTNLILKIGDSETLTATVSPSNATNKTVTWSSSNSNIASVNNGTVKGIGVGTATITAKCGTVSATCTVQIQNNVIDVTSVVLDKTTLDLKIGDTAKLTATVSPSNATDKTVTWSSSNSNIATVDNYGNIRAVSAGNATITAKSGSKNATCSVKVSNIEVTSVVLDQTTLDLKIGDTAKLTAIVSPSNATDKTVTWSSSNSNIATVDNYGNVRAVSAGNATITAKSGSKNATCSVKVSSISIDVTSVSLNHTSLELGVGETAQLTAAVTPSNATNKTVTWSSSNNSIVSVSINGLVRAVSDGNATITAQAGGITAECKVVSIVKVSSISLDKASLDIKVGETYQLKATVSPSNATNKSITWSSSNSNIASVDNNGNVKAIKEGTAKITAKNGSVSATCNITVRSNTVVIDGISYFYEDGSSDVSVVAGSYGSLSYANIPKSVVINSKTYNVTRIDNEAFKNCTSLKEVILPSSIKTVGSNAFAGCTGLLKSAYSESLPNPFTYGVAISYPSSCIVQDGIIYDSQKTKIYYASVKTKGEFSIPSTIGSIGPNAFKNCLELNSISIGNSVIDIGMSAFDKCTGLQKVKINDLAPWCSINFANETANPLYNGHSLILGDTEIIDLTLPQTRFEIKDYAFINCTQFKSITIPRNINSIGKKVFSGCNAVTTITAYPQNPPTITDDTFSNYSATLCVYEESESKYRNANYWKKFSNIERIGVVYLGIIGFNKELKSKTMDLLDLSSVDTYTNWVNNLTLNSNTLLYHAVSTGINTLQSTPYKTKLSNAVLVTFTDGLDQGSLALNYSFKTDQEFAQHLSETISKTKVQDVPLQAYAIGVKGTDVSDDVLFMTNLNSLSSKPENVHQVSNMSQINAEFDAIYEDIVRQKDQLILTISVPVMSDGALCRITFDNASSAESSKVWVQGTFNRSTMSLENITYEGLSSNSGYKIQGIQSGLNVSFTFFDCRDKRGNIMELPNKNYIDHWTYVNSNNTWQHNVEMGNNDIELEKRNSTAVMMLIDCSSSIGTSDFKNIQNVANIFIERLINYSGKYNTEVEEIYVDKDMARPMDIYTLQGICIKRNATEEDINNLPRGFYIIGGNKVLKR